MGLGGIIPVLEPTVTVELAYENSEDWLLVVSFWD